MRVHSLEEIDHKDFWRFVEQAVAGFKKITQRVQQDPESVMPWTVLGRKWHLLRKGFPARQTHRLGSRGFGRIIGNVAECGSPSAGLMESQPSRESISTRPAGTLGARVDQNGWWPWNCRWLVQKANSPWEELQSCVRSLNLRLADPKSMS